MKTSTSTILSTALFFLSAGTSSATVTTDVRQGQQVLRGQQHHYEEKLQQRQDLLRTDEDSTTHSSPVIGSFSDLSHLKGDKDIVAELSPAGSRRFARMERDVDGRDSSNVIQVLQANLEVSSTIDVQLDQPVQDLQVYLAYYGNSNQPVKLHFDFPIDMGFDPFDGENALSIENETEEKGILTLQKDFQGTIIADAGRPGRSFQSFSIRVELLGDTSNPPQLGIDLLFNARAKRLA